MRFEGLASWRTDGWMHGLIDGCWEICRVWGSVCSSHGKEKVVAWPMRVAVSGAAVTPHINRPEGTSLPVGLWCDFSFVWVEIINTHLLHSHDFKVYSGRVSLTSMMSEMSKKSRMKYNKSECKKSWSWPCGGEGFHQSHCPHGAHVCVRHHLQWIIVVSECLWVDPVPTILSPYVTAYRLFE